MTRAPQRTCQRREQSTRNQHRLSTRIFQQISVVSGRQERIYSDRNQTGVERTEKADWPVQTVVHQEKYPLFTAQAQPPHRLGEASNPILQLSEGQRTRIIDEGDFVGTPRIAFQKVLPDIEPFGWPREVRLPLQTGWQWRNRFWLHHGVSPRVNVRPTLTVGSRTLQALDIYQPPELRLHLPPLRSSSILRVTTLKAMKRHVKHYIA